MKKRNPGVRIVALGLLTIGGLLVADAYDVAVASFEQVWPSFIVLLSVALLSQNAAERRRRAGLTFVGTFLLLHGLFFLLITFRVGRLTWLDLQRLWPLLLVFVGASFLMAYIVGEFREKALLIPMYVLGGIGIFGLPVTLGTVQTIAFRNTLRLWPLAILLLIIAVSSRSDRYSRE
jgi:hypothetical protein